MGFFFFLCVTCALFIRPAEIIPGMEQLPTYEWLILACMACSLPQALAQLQGRTFLERPLNLCVLGMLAAIALSHLSHAQLRLAYDSATTFAKVAVYYWLLVANIDSWKKLRGFLATLTALIMIVGALALLQFHQIIYLPALELIYDDEIDSATGAVILVPRICGTGIFHDPNDLAMILVFGIVLCAYWLTDSGAALLKPLCLASLGLFGYGLAMTHSRGGLLALLAAMVVLFHARFGLRKAVPLIALVLPLMLVLFGGRQANFGSAVEADTGQQRIQLWAQGIELFKRSPLLGIGYDQYAEEARQVAHNSFVHCYTELGFLGGTVFFGAFFYAIQNLLRLGTFPAMQMADQVGRLRPYLAAAVTGFAVSMLTLSRSYVEPTYLMLGLASCYLSLAWPGEHLAEISLSGPLIKRISKYSVYFLIATYLFIRVYARWSGG